MSIGLISEIWKLLKPSIETGDIDDAAETLITWLVEEGYASAHEIKAAFRGEKEIKEALDYYIETPEDSHYHEHAEDDLFEDYEDDSYDDDDRY